MHLLTINHFLISQQKANKKHMKKFSKYQEMMTIKQIIY